jgi:prephenate dehydrogenase
VLFHKVGIVGVGLLGGSLGLAARERELAGRVEGWVRRAGAVALCNERDVADLVTTDLAAVIKDADLILLCTPVEDMKTVLEPVMRRLKPGAIVTDVGSVKQRVVTELEPLVSGAGARFVGSHPMAGGERVGVVWSRPDLFSLGVCAVTPTEATDAAALEQVIEFWQALGMRTLTLSPALHDELVARASHLPHLMAATLAGYVLDEKFPREQRDLCAGGFRDTTRIASGPVAMWRGILAANRVNLVRDIDAVMARLEALRAALEQNDAEKLEAILKEAHDRREHWLSGDTIFRSHGRA